MSNSKQNGHNKYSQKGLRGNQVGAPPKLAKFPDYPFTVATAESFNCRSMSHAQCNITLRKNIKAAVEDGSLIQLKSIPQKGHKVGRPMERFVKVENFDAKKMVRFTDPDPTPEIVENKTKKKDSKKMHKTGKKTPASPATPSPVIPAPVVAPVPPAPVVTPETIIPAPPVAPAVDPEQQPAQTNIVNETPMTDVEQVSELVNA